MNLKRLLDKFRLSFPLPGGRDVVEFKETADKFSLSIPFAGAKGSRRSSSL